MKNIQFQFLIEKNKPQNIPETLKQPEFMASLARSFNFSLQTYPKGIFLRYSIPMIFNKFHLKEHDLNRRGVTAFFPLKLWTRSNLHLSQGRKLWAILRFKLILTPP